MKYNADFEINKIVTFRATEQEREDFVIMCKRNKTSAQKVLHDFLKTYLKENDNKK